MRWLCPCFQQLAVSASRQLSVARSRLDGLGSASSVGGCGICVRNYWQAAASSASSSSSVAVAAMTILHTCGANGSTRRPRTRAAKMDRNDEPAD